MVCCCVYYGVIDISVPQIVLNKASIDAKVSQSITTGVAQHMRMYRNTKLSLFAQGPEEAMNIAS
ncbi:hypothetical protein GM31_12415 [Trabulsiella odontotermitis]|uniref:Uncharacterized protein n=1 Tax=Trabulsiella odontotermitis TaxID=379893 RepID=A0A0L0GK08_9ENTR|nr:hypothetical protein GM30_07415 [Trabulsiella odontotermitis]KNC94822.1 hypothetical protein GM31_12415 [Trabulsiella odontotermitis]